MLLEQTHFPLGKTSSQANSIGSNIGAIILVAIIIVGVGVAVYASIDYEPITPSLKKPDNEKQ